jgi:hypothetical protein
MTTDYSIDVDLDRRLMRVVISGFWNADIIPDFLKEIEQKEGQLAVSGRPYFVLTDLVDFPVQARETVDEFQKHLAAWSNTGSISAIIVPGALKQLQLKRIAEGGQRQTFNSNREAMQWLISKGLETN